MSAAVLHSRPLASCFEVSLDVSVESSLCGDRHERGSLWQQYIHYVMFHSSLFVTRGERFILPSPAFCLRLVCDCHPEWSIWNVKLEDGVTSCPAVRKSSLFCIPLAPNCPSTGRQAGRLLNRVRCVNGTVAQCTRQSSETCVSCVYTGFFLPQTSPPLGCFSQSCHVHVHVHVAHQPFPVMQTDKAFVNPFHGGFTGMFLWEHK